MYWRYQYNIYIYIYIYIYLVIHNGMAPFKHEFLHFSQIHLRDYTWMKSSIHPFTHTLNRLSSHVSIIHAPSVVVTLPTQFPLQQSAMAVFLAVRATILNWPFALQKLKVRWTQRPCRLQPQKEITGCFKCLSNFPPPHGLFNWMLN